MELVQYDVKYNHINVVITVHLITLICFISCPLRARLCEMFRFLVDLEEAILYCYKQCFCCCCHFYAHIDKPL